MSTIADYSVFTKTFLTSGMTDFSQLYGTKFPGEKAEGALRAFAVIPFNLTTPLTPREAMNFDLSKLGLNSSESNQVSCMPQRVSCRDANGNFIGNIVRVQPGERNGSIRFVAKVAVPGFVSSEGGSNPADAPHNTFVLVRTNACTSVDLPIAVATISKGYNLHKHKVVVANVESPDEKSFVDPLDDVENANYVSFTINNLNGYTSVDFNPDAYATYDDVANALSRGIDGLHIAFNSNTGDIILSDSKGNVIDQANLHLDLSPDTIIAEGEEGYKYVKTDINQNVHSAKAFMPSNSSAFGSDGGKAYNTVNASLVRFEPDGTPVCNGIRVCWKEQAQEGSEQATQHDEIYWVGLGKWGDAEEAPRKYLALNCCPLTNGQFGNVTCEVLRTASNNPIDVTGNPAIYSGDPAFEITKSVYDHDAFVHTVGNSSLADWDECFQLMGFHDGDDIPLGTDLPALMKALTDRNVKFDPEAWIHGADSDNAKKVADQRELAKKEMVEYNSRRPALTEDRNHGTIIDHKGLDVRNGSITLGCGRVGAEGVNSFKKINYGIQMKDRSSDQNFPNISESLDFTISHFAGSTVPFDGNGHAIDLHSSTLLSIAADSYISGAPTCLILAKVTRKPKNDSLPEGSPDPLEGSPVLTPIRMTAGFRVEPNYDPSSGLNLTIQDLRENISAVFVGPDNHPLKTAPAIIEVQAIYTHPAAQHETVPAQQMHTYIGEWMYGEQQPNCSFFCNKIEEWMTAIDLTDTNPSPDSFNGVGLYVVIRVY